MCISCATSADALLGGGIVSAAGLRVAMRSWLPTVRERLARPSGDDTDQPSDSERVTADRPVADTPRLRTGPTPHPA